MLLSKDFYSRESLHKGKQYNSPPHVFTSSDQLLLILKIYFTLLTKQTILTRRTIVQGYGVWYGIKISAGKCCQKYHCRWTSNSNPLIFLCSQTYKPHISTAGNLYSLHYQVLIPAFNIDNIFYFVNKTSYLNKEDNCTGTFTCVRVRCWKRNENFNWKTKLMAIILSVVFLLSSCWVSLCWMSLCWVLLCWMLLWWTLLC